MLSLARGKEGVFRLVSNYQPQGDQPAAIAALAQNIVDNVEHQVLLGVTGSGKTFTMAHVIAEVNRPTLVIAPNKTLAAQLYHEFQTLFPENAVRYFVSYYDYYQPEAYVPSEPRLKDAITAIREELRLRLLELRAENKVLEMQRLEQRTLYDLEMLNEMGFCHGIENYSRHLDGRRPGEPPSTLISYFAKDYLLMVDESHVTVPQIGGMYRGDRSRKETLVEFG